jgi:hypothetical protein
VTSDLQSRFEALEVELKEINTNKETLRRNLLDLIELQHILKKTQVFFQEVSFLPSSLSSLSSPHLNLLTGRGSEHAPWPGAQTEGQRYRVRQERPAGRQ